jgi:penicillin-binding protein 2A
VFHNLTICFIISREKRGYVMETKYSLKNLKSSLKTRWFRLTVLKRWLLSLIMIAGFAVIMIISLFALLFFNADISKLAEPMPVPTSVYDKNGELASQLSTSKIEPITIGQMPQQLVDAIVATEDRRFFKHSGVDFRSIFRALWRDIRSMDYDEGGSTITQQLAKNMFLPTDKTIKRKLSEAAYALKIELSYSKDEILVMYVNNIYYGAGQYGVQQAAKTYFNKDTKDLNLVESALLAGLPKAPSTYNPLRNPEAATERRNVVLNLMNEQQYITNAEYKTAQASVVTLTEQSPEKDSLYPDYMDSVLKEAAELYGFSEGKILSIGLSIYTTLDPVVQQAAEAVYADDQYFPESMADQLIQSGVVILDQHNGEIRGIVGHRENGVKRGFNYATQLIRQPGSSLKPLVVYAPALENGFTPESTLSDAPLNINGYEPRNYDLQTRGEVTLKQAITKSYNIPAVWLLNEIGIDVGIDYVNRSGISLVKEDHQLGIALGGMSLGTSPLRMAQAFSAFANLGEMHTAHTITRIVSSSGQTLVEVKPLPIQVTTPTVAYTMTTLLANVVSEGTGQGAALDRPTAGKTGTTQLPDTPEFAGIATDGSVSKDAWFIGYTPELTAAVWMGYDKTDRTHYLKVNSGAAALVFQEIMSRALVGQPIVPFPIPAEIADALSKDKKPDIKQEEKKEDSKKDQEKDQKKDQKKDERKDQKKDERKDQKKDEKKDRKKDEDKKNK